MGYYPQRETLPAWWQAVAGAFACPVPVWLSILMAESGGNPEANNLVPPDDSWGLFQLNRNGGQGAGLEPAILINPLINANKAEQAIDKAYTNALKVMAQIPLADISMADIAIDSGHPGQDRGVTRIEMRADSRVRRIVGIYDAANKAMLQGGNDLSIWQAAYDAYNGNVQGSPELPFPGIPGSAEFPDAAVGAAKKAGESVKDALGFQALLDSIAANKAAIALFIIAILFVGLGGLGLVLRKA